MIRLLFFGSAAILATLLLLQDGLSQTAGSVESAVMLHRKLESHCELVQKGTLLSEAGYAFLVLEGVGDQIYSPELGEDDFLAFPAGVPQQLAKLAQKSGFRIKRRSDITLSDLPKVVASGKASVCPALAEAQGMAERGRIARRHQLQSHLFHPQVDGVSAPSPIVTQRTKMKSNDGSLQPQPPPQGAKAKVRAGRVVLSIVVGSSGDVQQEKVIHSLSPEFDRRAAEAVANWKFRPARKNGLPVPVTLEVEVTFHLY